MTKTTTRTEIVEMFLMVLLIAAVVVAVTPIVAYLWASCSAYGRRRGVQAARGIGRRKPTERN